MSSENWIDFPTTLGYWWTRKKNGMPTLVEVHNLNGGGIEAWYSSSIRRFYQFEPNNVRLWQEVERWKK